MPPRTSHTNSSGVKRGCGVTDAAEDKNPAAAAAAAVLCPQSGAPEPEEEGVQVCGKLILKNLELVLQCVHGKIVLYSTLPFWIQLHPVSP